jgi:hypothetical protein
MRLGDPITSLTTSMIDARGRGYDVDNCEVQLWQQSWAKTSGGRRAASMTQSITVSDVVVLIDHDKPALVYSAGSLLYTVPRGPDGYNEWFDQALLARRMPSASERAKR